MTMHLRTLKSPAVETFQDWNITGINHKGDIITESPDVSGVMEKLLALARDRIYLILILSDERRRFVAVSEDRIPEAFRETELVLVPDSAGGKITIETRFKDGRKNPEQKPRTAAEIFNLTKGSGLRIVGADGNYFWCPRKLSKSDEIPESIHPLI